MSFTNPHSLLLTPSYSSTSCDKHTSSPLAIQSGGRVRVCRCGVSVCCSKVPEPCWKPSGPTVSSNILSVASHVLTGRWERFMGIKEVLREEKIHESSPRLSNGATSVLRTFDFQMRALAPQTSSRNTTDHPEQSQVDQGINLGGCVVSQFQNHHN